MSATNGSELSQESTLDKLFRELCSDFSITSSSERVIFDSKKAKLLKFLVEEGYVMRATLERLVHSRLLLLGEWTFDEHRRGTPVDHCFGSHLALGYAIKHDHVPVREITFDHGEIAGEYVVAADGLLESVVEQLFTYKESNPSSGVTWGRTSPLFR